MAYQARLIAHAAKVAEISKKLDDGRLSVASRKKLQDEMNAVKKAKPKHFDHLETAAAYHILKGYNSSRPAALHVTDVRQWRKVIAVGPLTNAMRGGKAKSKRSAPAAPAGDASAATAAPAEEMPAKKILRAAVYSKAPDGEVPWPSSRLAGSHRLGWHPKGSRSTRCDHPGCSEIEKTATAPSETQSSTASSPRRAAMPPPPPRTGGRSTGGSSATSRAPSPTPSDASSSCSTASTSRTVTKMYCMDCYDPSNTRTMNFHAECWNIWHGLCDQCPT